MPGYSSFEPVDCGCAGGPPPSGGHPGGGKNDFFQDYGIMGLLILAIVLFCFYYIIKTGVKGGILEALNDPQSPLSPCRGN